MHLFSVIRLVLMKFLFGWLGGTTGSASDQQSTNDRKVAGLRSTKVVCITVLTGNRLGWTARCGRPPLLLPSCRKLEFRLSVLIDSDLAWVNGKSGRQSWRYADTFQRSIISEAIYHLPFNWVAALQVAYMRRDCRKYSLQTERVLRKQKAGKQTGIEFDEYCGSVNDDVTLTRVDTRWEVEWRVVLKLSKP